VKHLSEKNENKVNDNGKIEQLATQVKTRRMPTQESPSFNIDINNQLHRT
jgi:hypothetical protein